MKNVCNETNKAYGSKILYRQTDVEMMRVNQEQNKLQEAYETLENQLEITDLAFNNRLFMYHNEMADAARTEVRRLKDDYRDYMLDFARPAAKLELKYKAPKNLVRRTKFIKI